MHGIWFASCRPRCTRSGTTTDPNHDRSAFLCKHTYEHIPTPTHMHSISPPLCIEVYNATMLCFSWIQLTGAVGTVVSAQTDPHRPLELVMNSNVNKQSAESQRPKLKVLQSSCKLKCSVWAKVTGALVGTVDQMDRTTCCSQATMLEYYNTLFSRAIWQAHL